jgi:nucleotide-binding universal stress UspA family protein
MFRHVLIPIDLSHDSSWQRALPVAADQAKHYGAKLTLLTVLPNVRPVDPERHTEEDAKKKLKVLVAQHVGKDSEVDIRVEHHDTPHRYIRYLVSQEGIDLVVMNSHHPELSDYILGSNATQVVHHADCSVFVVRSEAE